MAGDEIPSELAIRRAQAQYMVEFGFLDRVAIAVAHGSRGDFLKKYAGAWLQADAWNKRLMRPVWEVFIDKYELEEDLGELPS